VQALVFLDIGAKTIGSNTTGGSFSFPKIVAGDDVRLKLRLLETIAGERIISRREISAIKLSVGRQDSRPTSGAVQLKLAAGAESGANTTAPIGFDSSPEDFAAALNALTDSSLTAKKPFAVTKRDGSWHVRAADDSTIDFSVADNSLLPQSLVSIRDYIHDEATHYEIRFIQTVIAEQTNWNAIVPELPSVSVVQHGATESGVKRNTIQQVFFPPELAEGYSFRLKWGFRRTTGIVLPTDETAIQSALDAVLEAGEAVKVSAGTDRVLIEFLGDLAGTDVSALEIESIVTPSPDSVINLSTATDAMAKYMDSIANAASGITEFKLPLSLTLWLIDEQDEEVTEEVTFIQEVTFQKPVSMAAFSNAATLNPSQPLSRTSYLPFTPSQVTETQRGYLLTGPTALGNGSSTDIVVTHNLGTRHVYVALFGSAVDGQMLKHGTDYEVEIVSDNAVKIIFPTAPDAGAVVGGICTVASTNAFVDLEINQGQVIGLEDRLTAIEEALAILQASAAVGSGGTRDPAAGTVIAEQSFRPIAEAYPLGLDLVAALSSSTAAASASSPAAAGAAAINTVADIPQEVLARFGDSNIFGAIHDSAAEALPSPKPAASAANKGKVYQNRTLAAVRLNGDGARDSYLLQPGEFCGCDGRALYALTAPGVPNGAFAFTVNTSTDTLSIPGVTLPNGTPVMCLSSTTLPSGLGAALTQRYVINSAAGSCKLSATVGGSALDITDAGTGTHYIFATAGTTTSFFPRDFERQLFISHVAESKLRVKGKCTGMFGFEAAMFSLSTAAGRFGQKITQGRWRLVVRIGVDLQEDTPATTRANLKRIVWNADPVLDELVHVTRDVAEVHTFGFQIARTAADAWTITKCVNGFWSASAATIDAANFWLTAELVEWDCEDMPDPEGVVVLLGLDKTNAKADSGIGKIKFT